MCPRAHVLRLHVQGPRSTVSPRAPTHLRKRHLASTCRIYNTPGFSPCTLPATRPIPACVRLSVTGSVPQRLGSFRPPCYREISRASAPGKHRRYLHPRLYREFFRAVAGLSGNLGYPSVVFTHDKRLYSAGPKVSRCYLGNQCSDVSLERVDARWMELCFVFGDGLE